MASEPVTLEGRVGVVTGASSGIGEATARRLAAEGMKVALGARRQDRLERLAHELQKEGADALPCRVDVTDWASVRAFAAAVEEAFGGCDVLVPNAGVAGRGNVQELPVEAWEHTIATNLTGAFHACKAFLPLMAGRDGWKCIVLIASVAGTLGLAGSSAYCAAKWGVRGFAQSLALEAAPQKIRVTTVNPGFVATPWHGSHPRATDMIQPEDVADLVVRIATLPGSALVDDVAVWPSRMYAD